MSAEPIDEKAVFNHARRIDGREARADYLKQVCGAHPEALQRVLELLQVHEQEQSFLESPAVAMNVTIDQPLVERLGTTIGPYKLLQQIGEGGMGVVYMAEQSQPVERRVALKIIKPGMDSRQVVARFEAERQALAMMDHPNIAKVFEAGTTESGRPFFVMELVKGIPITKYCDDKRLSLKERLELLVPVCQAIQHAHQKGIIHRDIKPNNVLVAQYDGKPVPKVIDFGVAKATAQKLTERTMFTELGQIIGTLEYMSPEQAELNQLDIDTRSDIYSLGVLLYELLTGTTPFDKQKLRTAAFHEMLRIIREDEPPRPSTNLSTSGTLPSIAANRSTEPARLSKTVRGELDWIVMKALEKDRNRRYETANGLASDIQRYLNDEHVQACPPSARYRFGKFARKNRAAFTTASIVALVLLIGTVVSTWQAIRAKAAEESERAAKQAESDQRKKAEVSAAEAQEQEKNAKDQLAVATAITEFLQKDLLGQAGSTAQADRKFEPDPNLTIRDALDRAAAAVGDKFKDRPLLEASIRETIGDAYSAVGEYEKAITQFRQSAALRTSQLGHDHPDTLDALGRLASAYDAAGQTTEAIALHEQVRDARVKKLGPDHADTLASICNLANAYFHAGKTGEATAQYERAREVMVKKLGPDHATTLATLCNLAVSYQDAGKLTEAIALLEQVRDVSVKKFSPEHPSTLAILHSLASAYGAAGKTTEAIALSEQVRDANVKILGPEHPDTLSTLNNLAGYYESAGRTTEAIALFEHVRDAEVKKLGPDHPSTLATVNNLARAYWTVKQLDKSIPLFEQVLEAQRKKQGERHPETLVTLANLGVNYRDAGRLAEAIPLLEQAYREGRKHAALDWVGNSLASAYDRAGRSVEAVALAEERIQAARQTSPNSLRLAQLLADRGFGLVQQQAWSDAEPILRECLAIREEKAPDDWKTFNIKSVLGGCLLGQQKCADAEPLLLAGYEGMNQLREKTPANRLREGLERLVRLYGVWNKQEEATRWRTPLAELQGVLPQFSALERAVELDPENWENHHKLVWLFNNTFRDYHGGMKHAKKVTDLIPEKAVAWHDLAGTYRLLGDPQKAVELETRAIEIGPMQDFNYWFTRGNAYEELGEHDKALSDYSEAIRLMPNLADLYVRRAQLNSRLGNQAQASADYEIASELKAKKATQK